VTSLMRYSCVLNALTRASIVPAFGLAEKRMTERLLSIMENRRIQVGIVTCSLMAALCLPAGFRAGFAQSVAAPSINASGSSYDAASGKLVIKGRNFQPGASINLTNSLGLVNHGRVKVKGSKKILVSGIAEADIKDWLDVRISNPDGGVSDTVRLILPAAAGDLSADEVRLVIAQAVAQAEASGLRAVIAVTDREGNVLGAFNMTGAPAETTIGIGKSCAPCGLEGARVPTVFTAVSKAGTGAFLSSQGHAFSTRTASFIVQEHFPPRVDFTPGGPLFGVQFSQLLCSDINPKLGLGLAADPGGVPLYKNGVVVGGVGVEGDGRYGADPEPTDKDIPVEELVAIAATRGFETPAEIRGEQIVVNGIRFPFVNAEIPAAVPAIPFGSLRGSVVIIPGLIPDIRGSLPSQFRTITLGSLQGRVDNRFFPFQAGSGLTAGEVERIIVQAAAQAFITRAAIRQPLNSAAEVNIAVVDADGEVLGIFSTPDAPMFGFDVCVQKARTAALFSNASAAAQLRAAEGGSIARYVDAAASDGVRLDGSVAFSDRAQGFLSRPFFPDGINEADHGPFSVPIEDFSPFNVGLQLDLLQSYVSDLLRLVIRRPCTTVGAPAIANGLQIFPGSVPLYKNGRLVGAIGVSGDGVDQDDLIAAMGSAGFEAPAEIRSDRVFVRGVRLPYVKFPRHPNR
jgi:uncharacterized protein GlcG (DUF336 family)